MTTDILRKKLKNYIVKAEEKKIKALYQILESEMATSEDWWNDQDFVKELDHRYKNWKLGKSKSYPLKSAIKILTKK